MKNKLFFLTLFFGLLITPVPGASQEEESMAGLNPDFLNDSLFQDTNEDGVLSIVGFGDSLMRGTGDFVAAGSFVELAFTPGIEAGPPLRIELLAGIEVSNMGTPGLTMVSEGVRRFASTVPGARPDVVIIQGGSNDAINLTDSEAFSRAIQTMLNITFASGGNPVLTTIPPSCCNRAGRGFFTGAYNNALRELAAVNDVPLSDTFRAFQNTCANINRCELLNIPEGLHPNSEGYDVMGETVLATLLQIDLFAPEGAETLERALNLTEGSVQTKPDPVSEQQE